MITTKAPVFSTCNLRVLMNCKKNFAQSCHRATKRLPPGSMLHSLISKHKLNTFKKLSQRLTFLFRITTFSIFSYMSICAMVLTKQTCIKVTVLLVRC